MTDKEIVVALKTIYHKGWIFLSDDGLQVCNDDEIRKNFPFIDLDILMNHWCARPYSYGAVIDAYLADWSEIRRDRHKVKDALNKIDDNDWVNWEEHYDGYDAWLNEDDIREHYPFIDVELLSEIYRIDPWWWPDTVREYIKRTITNDR